MNTIKISEIKIGDRARKEYKNIEELAESIIQTNGLIHPITLDKEHRLVAGGRRIAAYQLLGLEEIPFVYKDTPDEAALRLMELEENVQRDEMTWQERCLAIAELVNYKKRMALLQGNDYTYAMAGKLFGISTTHVGHILRLAKEIKKNNEQITKCDNQTDAVKVLLQQKEDEIYAELMKRRKEPRVEVVESIEPGEQPAIKIDLSSRYINCDCLEWLEAQPERSVDHIITDPPYGIDVDVLRSRYVNRIKATHDVEQNLLLLHEVIPHLYRVLRDGYCILWCDYMHFRWLHDRLAGVGFAVQRWPFVWVKPGNYVHNAPTVNFSKTTEIAVIAHKGRATLCSPQLNSQEICIPSENRDKLGHSFYKPETVWKRLIEAVVVRGAHTFVDPFAGVGSSLAAAIKSGYDFFGIEIDPKHYAVGFEHLSEVYKQTTPSCEVL